MRAYRLSRPDYESDRYRRDKDKVRQRHLRRKYGIGLDDYAAMLDGQDGKCAICAVPEPADKMFDVDHDHATGAVRGLLCATCNQMIGYAHDSTERLAAAIAYLSSRK